MNELFYLLGLYFCIGSLILFIVPSNQLFDTNIARNILSKAKYILQMPYGLFSQKPVIHYFETIPFLQKASCNEATIYENDFFQIYWRIKNAYKVTLTDFGNVTGLTSIRTIANFSHSKIFLLEAWGHGGYSKQSLKVQIANPSKFPQSIAENINSNEVIMPQINAKEVMFQVAICANRALLPEFHPKISPSHISNIGYGLPRINLPIIQNDEIIN